MWWYSNDDGNSTIDKGDDSRWGWIGESLDDSFEESRRSLFVIKSFKESFEESFEESFGSSPLRGLFALEESLVSGLSLFVIKSFEETLESPLRGLLNRRGVGRIERENLNL